MSEPTQAAFLACCGSTDGSHLLACPTAHATCNHGEGRCVQDAAAPLALSCDCGHERHADGPCHKPSCPCDDYVPETHPAAPDERGCYGWPRACSHDDDLGCMEAERAQGASDV